MCPNSVWIFSQFYSNFRVFLIKFSDQISFSFTETPPYWTNQGTQPLPRGSNMIHTSPKHWWLGQSQTLLPINRCACTSDSILKHTGPISKVHITSLQCQNRLSASPSRQWTIPSYCQHISSKILLYMDWLVHHWFVFNSKICSTSYKFSLFILHLVQLSFKPFHLQFCSFLCLKTLTPIFSLKIMYIMSHLSSQKSKNHSSSTRFHIPYVSEHLHCYHFSSKLPMHLCALSYLP